VNFQLVREFAVGRRSRWVVIGVWLLLAVALGSLQPKLQQKAADESKTFRARGAESTKVHDLIDQRFVEGGQSTAVIAYYAKHGVEAQAPLIGQQTAAICGSMTLPDLAGVGTPDSIGCGDLGHHLGPENPPTPFSRDEPPKMVLIPVVNSKDDTDSMVRDVAALRKLTPGPNGSPLASYVTGQAGFDADRATAVEGIDGTLLAITMTLVLVLMLVIYRSPTIATVMLGVVALAYLIATGILYGLVEAGATTVSGQSTAILIVLMFGAGTDYALLIVSRYRDELRRTEDAHAALVRATARTSPAILASAGIVIAAMLVLGLADFNATREMGPILALGIVVMMAAGLTLLPAVLSVLGRRAFWPVVPRAEASRRERVSPLWSRISGVVRRRPALLVVICTGILTAGALGNLGGRGFLDLTEQYRDPPESVVGQELIREHYSPGRAAPVDIVTSSLAALPVRDAMRRVAQVSDANTDSQSISGSLVTIEALLKVDPFSNQGMDLIPRLREQARKAAGRETVLVGGITAEQHDNVQALSRDAKLIVPLVLLLILVVLIALLRCVVAPLYVIGTVVLSFAFALGASSLAFTHLFGQPDSDPNLALFAFIFLVALGVDDNIFLMTRVREERARGLSTREAVIAGLESTGGVITSAGLILAGTFAALMALDLEALFQVGFTVTLGLLVDAFLVRTFLVPSIALLLGERNWWPQHINRGVSIEVQQEALAMAGVSGSRGGRGGPGARSR
jgi:putative drug exporter of the RND superfamily